MRYACMALYEEVCKLHAYRRKLRSHMKRFKNTDSEKYYLLELDLRRTDRRLVECQTASKLLRLYMDAQHADD